MADLTTGGELESKLWSSAEQLRGTVESSQYKHIVLEILSIKSFTENPEKSVLTIPDEATWDSVVSRCKSAGSKAENNAVSCEIDLIIESIESSNPGYTDVIPRGHARTDISDNKLMSLIQIFDEVDLSTNDAQDPFGRIYEYFLTRFAKQEGRRAGEYYTPKCVVNLLVSILEPYSGKVFDPFCGSGGMFVQSDEFLENSGESGDIDIYGQELKETTWRICRSNLTRAGLSVSDIAVGDSITDDQHDDLEADHVISNPPFNMEEWGQSQVSQSDPRFKYGFPDKTGNFAYMQHMIHHTAEDGMVGTVMANRAMFVQGTPANIRKSIIEDDLLDIVISLPDNLFYSTPIPASIWVLSKGKGSDDYRNRADETLLIDGRSEFTSRSNSLNEMNQTNIDSILSVIQSYRAETGADPYRDQKGFCQRVHSKDLLTENCVVTPGKFVGKDKAYTDDSGKNLEDLYSDLNSIIDTSEQLNDEIRQKMGVDR